MNIFDIFSNRKNLLFWCYILLLAMFVLSGINKIFNYDNTVLSLSNKINPIINLDNNIYKLTIVLVIILELVAPYIIIKNSYNNKHDKYSLYSGYLLIIFTILATLIYHPLHLNNYMKSLPFWSNMSLLAGLILMTSNIKNNN